MHDLNDTYQLIVLKSKLLMQVLVVLTHYVLNDFSVYVYSVFTLIQTMLYGLLIVSLHSQSRFGNITISVCAWFLYEITA